MSASRPPFDDLARLRALAEHDILGATPDPALERIVNLAARLLGAPAAFISFVDRDRQVFHAKVGLALCETGRDIAFCDRTIRQDAPLIVPDASRDPRFRDNPLVTGAPFIRFYAGVPLRTLDGHAIGTLCLAGPDPRPGFSEDEVRTLVDLARLACDRLELRRAEIDRRSEQTRFEHIAGTSPDGVICTDARGCITFWNAAAEHLFGHAAAEVLGRPLDLIVPERLRGGHDDGLRRLAEGGAGRLVGRTVELFALHRDGGEFPVELSLSAWREGEAAAFGAIVRDVSERRAVEERLYRLAHHDALTGLLNRQALGLALDSAVRSGSAAVLLVDLDGFKDVNDGHGHAAGDAVLRLVGERLRGVTGSEGIAARLGGDEFALVLPGVGDPLTAVAVAEATVSALAEPFLVEGRALQLGASVGFALAPGHGEGAEALLACADAALYRAKADGRGRWRLFTPDLREAAQRERACRDGLALAFERGEFELYYQPQVRLSDGALAGVEALIRWRHPDHGLLAPAAFLPTLEAGPLAAGVGDWVLRTACIQAAAWRRRGFPDLRVGVNLFGAQLARGDFAAVVRRVLAETGLEPSGLELEITENIILRHDGALVSCLRELRGIGVGVAFDDYGTGYASLSLLKRFPLTRLKIDRGFVQNLESDPRDAAVVRAVIALARGFGLAVTAEGIETQEQRRRLDAKGCAEAQGYLFGKPMPAATFERTCLAATGDAEGSAARSPAAVA